MRLFLDSSVALAACGRPHGASRAIVNAAAANGWELVSSGYSVAEVTRNLGKLPGNAAVEWQSVASRLRLVRDVWTNDRPAVFGVAKDRPGASGTEHEQPLGEEPFEPLRAALAADPLGRR